MNVTDGRNSDVFNDIDKETITLWIGNDFHQIQKIRSLSGDQKGTFTKQNRQG